MPSLAYLLDAAETGRFTIAEELRIKATVAGQQARECGPTGKQTHLLHAQPILPGIDDAEGDPIPVGCVLGWDAETSAEL